MESLSGIYISQLNEYQQRTQATVEYEEGSTAGPSHNKRFTMRAIVNGERFPDGSGKTKKEAKQNAAKNALEGLKNTPNTETTSSTFVNVSSNVTKARAIYTCWLNEYAQKNKNNFKARESNKMDPGNPTQLCTYICKFVCGDKEFPEAYGKTKREAKEAAAAIVYEELCKTTNAEVLDENSIRAQRSEFASRSTSVDRSSCADDSRSSTPDHNYIAYLNDFCQKNNRVFDINLAEKRGPAHNPEFVYKVVMDGKEYPEGQGKTAREAKQNAAQHAWNEIRDQYSWTTQSPEDDTPPLNQESLKSEDPQSSSNMSTGSSPSSSDFITFKDTSAVASPISVSPCVSPLDVKTKRKLAPTFLLSPNGLAGSREIGPNMNIQNPTKPSGGQTSNPATKSRFSDEFDSITRIGKGGFGRVFKARRKLENKCFAVKIVKCTEKARREVSALANLTNPNIVRYYTAWVEDTAYRHESSESFSDSGSGTETEFLYIQMELCEGDTLRAWIEKTNSSKKALPERREDAAQISRQVLKAVEYLHSKSLIHRDLKPPNIMFSQERVKVGDFGLVTAAENENDEQLLERTKRTGTRSYMSPEQATQTSYDWEVDIYALGLIYFELLWNLSTRHERDQIWEKLRNGDFPPAFSETFSFEHKLIERMLSFSPKDRPNANTLIRELDQHYTHPKMDKDSRSI